MPFLMDVDLVVDFYCHCSHGFIFCRELYEPCREIWPDIQWFKNPIHLTRTETPPKEGEFFVAVSMIKTVILVCFF